jgi:hypothetical protein
MTSRDSGPPEHNGNTSSLDLVSGEPSARSIARRGLTPLIAAVPWACACLVCFFLGVTAIGWSIFKNDGFPMDDSWIHQVVGRNAAEYGVPGFSPGAASSGSTSAIWPWIIALNYRLLSAISPVTYLFVVNTLCLLMILVILYTLAQKDRLPLMETSLMAGLPAVTGNFVWLISSGMEHLLFIAAVFAAAGFWLHRPLRPGLATSIGAGVSLGLAILTRPEALFFLPLFLLTAWPLRKSRKQILAMLVPSGIAAVLLVLNNLWLSHSLLPVTLSGRRWLLYPDQLPPSALQQATGFVKECANHVVNFVLGFDFGIAGHRVALVLTVVTIGAGISRLMRRRAWRTLFLLLLALVNFSVYCVVLPTIGHAMRYQALLLIFIFPLVALGTLEIADLTTTRLKSSVQSRHAAQRICAVAITGLALWSLVRWNQITDVGIKHINGTHVRMGNWLAANVPSDTTVASFDIGGIGYFSHAHVVDLGGLIDPTYLPYLYRHKVRLYLKSRGIRLIVLPVGYRDLESRIEDSCVGFVQILDLCDGNDLTKREILSFASPRGIWELGVRATDHASQSQVLYEVIWH